ncbi:MAG: hypothetical protein ACOC28_07445 [Alkalispirochaetaceae bacterium]
MELFINHIGYIGITLLAGMAIGWSTYPFYRALIGRLRGEDRVRTRRDEER